MEHHKIIHSKEQIIKFIQVCFQDNNDKSGQAITVGLIARKKYYPALSGHSACVADIIYEGDIIPEKFYRSILRWEVPLGCYVDLKTGDNIPDSAFAVYIDLDAKDTVKALSQTMTEITNKLHFCYHHPDTDNKEMLSLLPYKRYRKVIRGSYVSNNNKLVQIDIDTKDTTELIDIKDKLIETGVEDNTIMVVETRAGYHLIFTSNKNVDNKTLYTWAQTTKISKLDSLGRPMVDTVVTIKPHASVILPGTFHAGFPASICENFFEM